METFKVRVKGITSDMKKYYVERIGGQVRTSGQAREIAYPLSPVPTSGGSGMLAVPASFANLEAICFKDGMERIYLLGFIDNGAGKMNTPKPELGEVGIRNQSGGGVKVAADGSTSMVSDSWAQWILGSLSQSAFGQFRHMTMKWWTGWLTFVGLEDTGKLSLYLAKKVNKAVFNPTQVAPDDYKLEIGTLENDAIVKWTVQCDATLLKKYNFTMLSELGNFTKKKAIHYEQQFADVVSPSKASFDVGIDGEATYTIKGSKTTTTLSLGAETHSLDASADGELSIVGAENSVHVTINVAGPDLISISTNKSKSDKCTTITVDASGNVKLKTPDLGKIYLGGSGKEQQLLTKSYHDNWAATHIHPVTSPGVPTGPPMLPLIALPLDSSTAPFTYSTLAE